jgi:hypothetical protein
MDIRNIQFNFEYSSVTTRAKATSEYYNQFDSSGAMSQTSESVSFNITSQQLTASVHSEHLNSSLIIDNQTPNFALSSEDMREVASKVLHFVGSVVQQAFKNGESEESLSALLESGRRGVADGFAAAAELLGTSDQSLNESIYDGRKLIDRGIDAIASMLLEDAQTPDLHHIQPLHEIPVAPKGVTKQALYIGRGEATTVSAELSLKTSFKGVIEDGNNPLSTLVTKAEALTIRYEHHHIAEAYQFVTTHSDSQNLWNKLKNEQLGQNSQIASQYSTNEYHLSGSSPMLKVFTNDLSAYVEQLLDFQQLLLDTVDTPDQVGKALIETFSVEYKITGGSDGILKTNAGINQRLGTNQTANDDC